ncbi:ATP-binding protein [Kribbella sp. NPDC004536]|uniref:ATP-binding protein n=1 Tax=Kribbella sp. NPDC004536 TaxID=3364106 RepID=UPI00369063E7
MPERVVGRTRELSTLTGLLDEVERGRGQGALVIGDAGIGKSTTAAVLADTARSRGYAVAWGRCPETEALPYWPWRQVFRALGLSIEPGDGARTSMFAAVADQLTTATAAQPAVIIVEDIHLADGSTLALLRFVVGLLPELRCLLLVTSRDNAVDVPEPAADALRALPPSFVRVPLGGLDRAETGELVAQVVGDADSTYADAVHARTGGNPFFVQELARWDAARGTTSTETPTGVRQVLERRLARLRQHTYDVLAVAAVLGEDVDLRLLAAVADTGDVLAVLGDAVAARLASVSEDRLRFAHSLVREVVYGGLGVHRRSELHLRAAELLAGQNDAGQVAAHYRSAGVVARSQEFALVAARAARDQSGYEQAVRFYGWADLDDPVVRVELGAAQVLAGELTAGRDTLRAVARTAGDPETVARAVLAMGGGVGGFEVDLGDEESTALLERVVPQLPDDALKAAALARLSLGKLQSDRGDRPRQLADEAVRLASAAGDAAAEVAALAVWCDVFSGPDHVAERMTAAERMLVLGAGDLGSVLLARRLLVVGLLEQGRFVEADVQIAAYARAVLPLRLPLYGWLVPVWRGMRALMAGRLDETRSCIEEATQLSDDADSPNGRLMVFALRAAHADVTGVIPELRTYVEGVMGPFVGNPMVDGPSAYYFARTGATEQARRTVRRRVRAGLDEIPRDAEWLESLAFLGEAGRVLGEDSVAQVVYDALRPYAGLWVIDGIGGACLGKVTLFLGRLAAKLNRPEARQLLEDALEAHRAAGAETLVAETEKSLTELGAEPVAAFGGAGEVGALKLVGLGWEVSWRGVTAQVADGKGVRDLAVLLGRPRVAVSVVELSGQTPGGDLGPVIDGQARAAYRERVRELEAELAEAEDGNDLGRVEKLRVEREFLVRELAGALGLGGRARVAGDPVERSRKAVSMRIGVAVKAIERVHPALGRHLRASIRTGRQCVYEPENDVTWHCQSTPGAQGMKATTQGGAP